MHNRYLVVGITGVAALWMYIDRVCFSTLADPIANDLHIGEERNADLLGAFFLTYALCQIPFGVLADRFGPRRVLTLSIIAWSTVTALTGFAESFASLVAIRFLLGVSESGAYPAAAGLVKQWAGPTERGRFNSVITLGGRLGGAAAPWLTTGLVAALAVVAIVSRAGDTSGVNWRSVFVLYGLCGFAVAALFWVFVRDRPPGQTAPLTARPRSSVVRQILLLTRSVIQLAGYRQMWYFGLLQLGLSLGWTFLITLLPRYLAERFAVELDERGRMQSAILITGCVGMVLGGLTADRVRRACGPRFGRAIPIAATSLGCAAAFFVVPWLSNPWSVVAALAGVAFLVDLGVPSVWAYAQDVGGKNVGAAFGWGNMMSNLGAWQSSAVLIQIKKAEGWDVAFAACGLAFVAAAVCGLMLDASRPLEET